MSFLIQALDEQLYHSLYAPNLRTEDKQRFATLCNRIKVAAAVVAFTAPVFAFFLPIVFTTVVSFATVLITYDLFNIADNLGDAARHSAQGFKPTKGTSHVEIMIESTLLANHIYQRIKE